MNNESLKFFNTLWLWVTLLIVLSVSMSVLLIHQRNYYELTMSDTCKMFQQHTNNLPKACIPYVFE